MTFTLKFERRFSMAHRLISGTSKKCSIPHGHNEFIQAYLQAKSPMPLDKNHNMVATFADAKTAWHRFVDESLDHCFQVRDDDPILSFFKEKEQHLLSRIVTTPGDPTTEMMCACLMSKLQTILDANHHPLNCVRLELQETPTNSVLLEGVHAYRQHLPTGDYWWSRADTSINEFNVLEADTL